MTALGQVEAGISIIIVSSFADGTTGDLEATLATGLEVTKGTINSFDMDVYVKDQAGNKSDVYNITYPPITNDIEVTYSTTEWTNSSVTVTATTETSYTIQYSTDGSTWTSGSTSSYAYTMTANGSVYFRLSDGSNTSDYVTGTVENIDTTAPEVSLVIDDTDSTSITVTATASDEDSGLYSYKFYYGTSSTASTLKATVYSTKSSYQYTYSSLSVATTYYIKVKVYDVAGNSSTSDVLNQTTTGTKVRHTVTVVRTESDDGTTSSLTGVTWTSTDDDCYGSFYVWTTNSRSETEQRL